MSKFNKKVSELRIVGRFVGLVHEDSYKLKGIKLETNEGVCFIKLSKELRNSFSLQLTPGEWLRIVGEQKLDLKKGKLKFKASEVIVAQTQAIPVKPATVPQTKKASILVCQKSDCMKRGGKGVCQALEAALSERGLEDQVEIKGTGCMKKCSAGPNVVMPDKTRYTRINARQVPEVIEKHFSVPNADELSVNSVELAGVK